MVKFCPLIPEYAQDVRCPLPTKETTAVVKQQKKARKAMQLAEKASITITPSRLPLESKKQKKNETDLVAFKSIVESNPRRSLLPTRKPYKIANSELEERN